MNYRHIYHAGSYADVFKHIILIEILQKLREKEKPFCVIDTHAGLGMYALQSIEAQKTLEFEKGIVKFLHAAKDDLDFKPYIRVIESVNGEDLRTHLKNYHGSPYFSRFYLRKEDRLRLCEFHPEDIKILEKYFEKDRRVKNILSRCL